MRILVYGAGVLGSLFAARLGATGQDVSILARGQRLAELRSEGIVLEEAATGQRTTNRQVQVVDSFAARDAYDLVLVLVRKTQLASVLPDLAANELVPTMLFMVNNAEGPGAMIDALGRQRVLLGFAGAGGTRVGPLVRYHVMAGWQQPTTLGELDGHRSARLGAIAGAIRAAGFPVAISPRMDAWLKTHAAWITSAAGALYMVGGDNFRLARTHEALLLWIRSVRECFAVLRALGIPVTPASLRVFELMPEPLMVQFLARLMNAPTAEVVLARHVRAAPDENAELARELRALAEQAHRPTPALDRLRTFIDQAARTPVGV